LGFNDKLSGSLQRCKELVARNAQLPWPPPDQPTEDYVRSTWRRSRKRRTATAATKGVSRDVV
jgi:hypothetical protein